MKHICIYLFICIFFGCSSEYNLPDDSEIVKMNDGKSIIVCRDTVLYFPDKDFPVDVSAPVNPEEKGFLKSYSHSRNDIVWFKAKFGEWISDYGLNPEKIYFVRKEYYYQEYVQCGEGEIVVGYVPENSCMGLFETVNGKRFKGFEANVRDEYYSGCRTLIFFVGYDDDGNSVSCHIPCNPDELEWYFSWCTKEDFYGK